MLTTLLLITFFSISFVAFLTLYFLPVIVAYIRGHKNISAIFIMTFFIGWTFLGWLAALLWALNQDVEEDKDNS